MMKDMMQLEVSKNCKMLPDIARYSENIKAFSHQEKRTDMVMNSKGNRKKKVIDKMLQNNDIIGHDSTSPNISTSHEAKNFLVV